MGLNAVSHRHTSGPLGPISEFCLAQCELVHKPAYVPGNHGFVATPVQSPGLARLLGGPSTNQPNTLKGGSNVFTSPAKNGR
jgi:hypothetical protein